MKIFKLSIGVLLASVAQIGIADAMSIKSLTTKKFFQGDALPTPSLASIQIPADSYILETITLEEGEEQSHYLYVLYSSVSSIPGKYCSLSVQYIYFGDRSWKLADEVLPDARLSPKKTFIRLNLLADAQAPATMATL